MVGRIGRKTRLHNSNKDSAIHKLACMVSDKLIERGDILYNKSLRELTQRFRFVDKGGSGLVDKSGFRGVLRMCGVIEPSVNIYNSRGEFDLFFYDDIFGDSSQGLLDWEEFIGLVRDVHIHPLQPMQHIPSPSSVPSTKIREAETRRKDAEERALTVKRIGEEYEKDARLAEKMLSTLVTKLYERHSDKLALTKAFKHVDKDNSSTIDIDEFRLVLRLFGFEPTERQLLTMFRMFGAERIQGRSEEEISYAKFLEVMNRHQSRHPLSSD